MDYPKKISELIDLTIDAINHNDGEQALLVLKEMRNSFIVFSPPPAITPADVAEVMVEPEVVRILTSAFRGKCGRCKEFYQVGDEIVWTARRGGVKVSYCRTCGEEYL